MAEKKLVKVVFTLSSGKSIVYTMLEENALRAYEDWKKMKTGETSINITEIVKTNEGQITERLCLDLVKIDAIQIDDYLVQ